MFDAYLNLAGVKGGSTSVGYEEMIEVVRFEHEIHQPETTSKSMAAHGAAGRSFHGEFKIHKVLDCASPWLAQVCSAGDELDEAKMIVVRAEGSGKTAIKTELLTVYMTKVRVASVSMEGGRETEPNEIVGLAYDTIYWEYKTVEGGSNIGGWDLAHNNIDAPAP